jgi:tripartite-type tricarboxylate transporter receptor subunit TctC
MVPMGDTADNASVEALQAFVKSEIVDWGKLVRLAGIAGSQ